MPYNITAKATAAFLIIAAYTLTFTAHAETGHQDLKPAADIADSIPAKDSVSMMADSIRSARIPLTVDSLKGKNIFSILEGGNILAADTRIIQSDSMFIAMNSHIKDNASKKVHGFRIRIFFSNDRNARSDSEKTEKEFIVRFPQFRTYRSYSNPYFKVSAGDFRTKSDAMAALEQIKKSYPEAIIVKENIFTSK